VSLLLLLGTLGLFKWMVRLKGATLAQAQTVAANALVIGELFYLFNCRSLTRSMFRIGVFSNKAAIGGAVGMLVLQILFSHTAPMNRLFHTAPIGWDAWLAIGAVGLALYVIVDIEKYLAGERARP
jgi:Ca2+-transporting ATPase